MIAFLDLERLTARVDLSASHGATRWAKGPRVLLCDLPCGASFSTIDGVCLIKVRETSAGATVCRLADGALTWMIEHAAVLPLAGETAEVSR